MDHPDDAAYGVAVVPYCYHWLNAVVVVVDLDVNVDVDEVDHLVLIRAVVEVHLRRRRLLHAYDAAAYLDDEDSYDLVVLAVVDCLDVVKSCLHAD